MTRHLTLLASWLLCVYLSHAASVQSLDTTYEDATYDNQLANEANGVIHSQDRFQQDPITNIRVMYPVDGAEETIPVEFRAEISVNSIQEYNRFYGHKILCVEVDGISRETNCSPLMNPSIRFDALSNGNYTVRAFITDVEDDAIRYHESPDTAFSIVSEEALATRAADSRHGSTDLLNAMGLLEWATLEQVVEIDGPSEKKEVPSSILPEGLMATAGGSESLLVIGVKTAVVENFALRQAIRQTWASANALPSDVKVIFVGCVPTFTRVQSHTMRMQVLEAVNLEKQTYGDLLTDELRCEDSYKDLPNKVKEFLQYTTKAFPQTSFVMIADDDIYLRADRLADDLRKEDRTERLYIGQVWDQLLGRRQTPVRNTTERYYISEKSYPLHEYPPFAFGPHYLMSMDCARFIAMNGERLHGLGGMDDVSIAMWLLTIQVHVEHTPAFTSLRLRECQNGVISFADMSAFGIRAVHSNVVAQRNICHGFDRKVWEKIEPTHAATVAGDDLLPVKIQAFVHDIRTTTYLKVTSIISTPGNDGVKLSYYPSTETFQSYAERVCTKARRLVGNMESNILACHALSHKLRTQLQQQLYILEALETIDRAHLELWRYNLNVADLNTSPVIVAYSPQAAYSATVLECLFTKVFEHLKRSIIVVSEKTLSAHFESRPDVFVFSVLDSVCEPMSKPGCMQHYLGKYTPVTGDNNTADVTRFIMISGETATTQGLDEQVLLLSTISGIPRKNYAYISVASTSFGERLNDTPMALLAAMTTAYPVVTTERQFCAYLYARCDRPQREYMFDLLNALEPVDALGVCAGSSRRPDKLRSTSRYSTWYNDDAVTTFQRYRFVIAFENGAVPGYVTEKLVNPFLAGSIPIYLGSPSVSELFNPDSFIDCGRFKKLADCASYVMKVHNSPELYEQMRLEPPIRNITAFNEAFSWHPSVPSRTLADNVARTFASQ